MTLPMVDPLRRHCSGGKGSDTTLVDHPSTSNHDQHLFSVQVYYDGSYQVRGFESSIELNSMMMDSTLIWGGIMSNLAACTAHTETIEVF
jgi:hypothetical protein